MVYRIHQSTVGIGSWQLVIGGELRSASLPKSTAIWPQIFLAFCDIRHRLLIHFQEAWEIGK
jgi:hypothetical protein